MKSDELLRRVGGMHQLAGIDLVEVKEGIERGVRKALVRTGGGLEFTVHIDRGFDLGEARLNGINLTWQAPEGVVHPYAYQDDGEGWLRRFPGGLLTTCGLDNVGVSGPGYPLHGRFSATPARLLKAHAAWEGDRYVLELVGEVLQARLFGEHLVVTRRIVSEYGKNWLQLEDRIENRGYQESPVMLLYHCNFGYSLLDEGAEIVLDSRVTPRDEAATAGLSTANEIPPPTPNYAEQVFLHDVKANEDGRVTVALVNRGLSIAVVLHYIKHHLPYLTQWKQMGEGAYVLGLEPGTCFVLGFEEEARQGRVMRLAPGQTYETTLEFEFLSDLDRIDSLLSEGTNGT